MEKSLATHLQDKRQWDLAGTFRLWLYVPSHSQLIFRSLAGPDGVNTDVIFTGVRRVHVQANYDGMSLHELDATEAADLGWEVSEPFIAVRFMNTADDYVVCGAMRIVKNQLGRFEVPVPVPMIGVDM
jgi:hypothetical protein